MKLKETMKKIKWSTISYAALAVGIVLFCASLILSYALPRSHPWIVTFTARTPYPAVVIDYKNALTFREISQNMTAVKRFYENQDFSKVGLRIDFSTPDGQKRLKVREKEVLNKMVEDAVIMHLAQKRDIFVSAEAARQGVARKLEEYGSGKDVEKNLARLYGWTLDDFEKKVVIPSLYEEKLQESFAEETDISSQAKTKIEKAQELLKQGTSFEEVAKQYSEGQTAQSGGDLGWFSLADLAPELRKPVALQKIGVSGDVIESTLGFHIVRVEEFKNEEGSQLYHIRQIFAGKNTFGDWLTQQMKTVPLWVLSPEYRLDRETMRVEFRSQELKDFETELYQKSGGDAMFFF